MKEDCSRDEITPPLEEFEFGKCGEPDPPPVDWKGLPNDQQIVDLSKVMVSTRQKIGVKLQGDIDAFRAGIQVGALWMRDRAIDLIPGWHTPMAKMPPERKDVLICVLQEDDGSTDVFISQYSNGNWSDLEEGERVTHWMALLAEPKQSA